MIRKECNGQSHREFDGRSCISYRSLCSCSRADRVINTVKYDQIVIATEATVVSSVLGAGWSTLEKRIFEQFPYSPSTVIVHQDPSLMPGI
jgi:predicted NAD/FAD-binding protein